MTPQTGRSVLDGVRDPLSSVVRGSGWTIRGVGFWTAILLPVLYVPLVLLGHPWVVDVTNFVKVIALHLGSLVLGRGHADGIDAD